MFPESVILVVGSESEECEAIVRMLSDGHRVIGVETPEDALMHASDGVDLVISELDSAEFSGLQLLRKWMRRDSRTPFVMVTEGCDISSIVEAMKLGASDCIVKPVEQSELRGMVSRLLESGARARNGANFETEFASDTRPTIDIPVGTSLEDLERAAVEQALAQHQGNRTHAAKTLGISVRTLQRKLKAWGIPVLPGNHHGTEPSNSFFYAASEADAAPPSFSAHAHN